MGPSFSQEEKGRGMTAGFTSSTRALCAHPWHRRELGSHLTNVVRALALEARGYSVTVTELTGWEHSLKNELILARRVKRFDRGAQARLDELVGRFGIQPKLVRDLPQTSPPAP